MVGSRHIPTYTYLGSNNCQLKLLHPRMLQISITLGYTIKQPQVGKVEQLGVTLLTLAHYLLIESHTYS